MKIENVLLTPEMAEGILRKTPELSRVIRPEQVEILIGTIRRGEWKLTHQPIALDENGAAVDGGHRLTACVRAGVALPVMMATGVDPATFPVIDIGARRTPGDMLHIAGFSDTAASAAAARVVITYRNNAFGSAPWRRSGGAHMNRVTPTQILATSRAHPLLAELGQDARKISRDVGRHGLRSGVLAGLVVIAEDAPGFDRLRSEWVGRLADGVNLPAGSPILAWRKWAQVDGAPRSRPEIVCTLIKAWNAWQGGSFVSMMKINHGERMPVVKSVAAHMMEAAS